MLHGNCFHSCGIYFLSISCQHIFLQLIHFIKGLMLKKSDFFRPFLLLCTVSSGVVLYFLSWLLALPSPFSLDLCSSS
jgi:hypothetical protein